jgi:hypothetical protein
MRARARRSGFAVAARWEDYWAFAADMGERPSSGRLAMARPSAGYVPENCFWASGRLVEIDGIRLSIGQWAKRLGVAPRLIWDRIWLGIPDTEAVIRPRRLNRRTIDESVFAIRSGGMVSRKWGTFAEALGAWRSRRVEAAAAGYPMEVIRMTPKGDVILVLR